MILLTDEGQPYGSGLPGMKVAVMSMVTRMMVVMIQTRMLWWIPP